MMTKRIPHREEFIEGVQSVTAYVESHRDNAASHFRAFLKEFDNLDCDGRFLEIGPGPGFLTALIAEKKPKAQITALEPSSEMIEFAQNHLQSRGVNGNVRFIRGSVDDSEVMGSLGEFDLVYSTFSLHHWKKPNTAWRYLFSKLKKNGTLFIHDLKRVPWLYHVPFGKRMLDSIRAAYTPDEISDMLMTMGIARNQYTIKTPFPYFWMSVLIRNNGN